MLCVSFCGNRERRPGYSACANLPLVTICVGMIASGNVERPNRMTRFWIVRFWHSSSVAGLLNALLLQLRMNHVIRNLRTNDSSQSFTR